MTSKASNPDLLPLSTIIVSPAMIEAPTRPPTAEGTSPRVDLYMAPVVAPQSTFF